MPWLKRAFCFSISSRPNSLFGFLRPLLSLLSLRASESAYFGVCVFSKTGAPKRLAILYLGPIRIIIIYSELVELGSPRLRGFGAIVRHCSLILDSGQIYAFRNKPPDGRLPTGTNTLDYHLNLFDT